MFTKEQADFMLHGGYITPETHSKIVQKYADGGLVGASEGLRSEEQIKADAMPVTTAPTPSELSYYPSAQAQQQKMAAEAQAAIDTSNRAPAQEAMPHPTPVIPEPAMPQAEPMAQAAPAPQVMPKPAMGAMDQFQMPSEQYTRKAIELQQQAATAQAAEQQKALASAQKQAETDYAQSLERQKAIQSRLDGLTTDLASQKVDPNKVWNDSSTGAKFGAVLGMLLSGVGAGVTGRENMAVANINRIIDRDIDAQKNNITNKQNLYGRYLQELGDVRAAETASRLHLMTVAEFKMKEAAAKAATPQAQANAQMALGSLENQKLQYKIELGKMMSEAQSLGAGGVQAGIKLGAEPFNMLSNKEYTAKRVPVYDRGVAMQANTPEAAKEMNKVEAEYKNVLSALDELRQYSSLGSRLKPADRERVRVITKGLPAMLNTLNGYTQFTEAHEGYLKEMFSDPSILTNMLSPNAATNQLINDMKRQVELKRAQNYINYKPVIFTPGAK
jgi:hypothetical protein